MAGSPELENVTLRHQIFRRCERRMSSQSGTCGIRRETFVFLGCLSVVLRCTACLEQPSRVGVEQLTELTISMQKSSIPVIPPTLARRPR
jgi:hypothetical protein